MPIAWFKFAPSLAKPATWETSSPIATSWIGANRITRCSSIAAYTFSLLDLPGGNAPLALYGARISYDLFPALGVQPALGRNFLAAEDRPGQAQEIILSHDLWVNRFQSDPHITGKIIRLLGRKESDEYTVVGVMPAGFNFPLTIPTSVTPPSRQMAYWIPIGVEPKRGRSATNLSRSPSLCFALAFLSQPPRRTYPLSPQSSNAISRIPISAAASC